MVQAEEGNLKPSKALSGINLEDFEYKIPLSRTNNAVWIVKACIWCTRKAVPRSVVERTIFGR